MKKLKSLIESSEKQSKKLIVEKLNKLPNNMKLFIINLVSNYKNYCKEANSLESEDYKKTYLNASETLIHQIKMLGYFNILRFDENLIIDAIEEYFLVS